MALREGKRIDEDLIVTDYDTGHLSLRKVAAKHGLSYGTVHRVVTGAGKMRGRGGQGVTRA